MGHPLVKLKAWPIAPVSSSRLGGLQFPKPRLPGTLPQMETAREPSNTGISASRAWYGATIADFLQSTPEFVFAHLASNPTFPLLATQKSAWLAQIDLLRLCLSGLEGSLFLEFNIPRMGRRIDAVLLAGPVVFVIEFKVGETAFDRAAIDQVWDYALDLKNFHAASHAVALIPILLATPRWIESADRAARSTQGPVISSLPRRRRKGCYCVRW